MVEESENPDAETLRNICDVRARFRNSFRTPILETTNLLNRRIPEIDASAIMQEEEDRLLSRARRHLRMGIFPGPREAYGEALQFRARKNETESLHNEEFGKYMAGKIFREWRKDGIDSAFGSFREVRERPFLSVELRESVAEETVFTVKSGIVKMIKRGDFRPAVEGILKFADVCKFTREDFYDLGMTESDELKLMKYLETGLVEFLDKNPRIYDAVVSYFLTGGFKSAAELCKAEPIRAKARLKIKEAAGMGVCYLTEAMEVFEELGLINEDEAKKWPEVMEMIGRKLGDAVSKSPAAYVQMRNYYVRLNIITKEEADGMAVVKDGLNKFLVELTNQHPELAMTYAASLRCHEVKVEIEPALEKLWRDYSSSGVPSPADPFEDAKFKLMFTLKMKDLAIQANIELNEDKQHELMVFNGVRHLYGLELANFIIKYPYFGKFFKEFNPGEYLGDGG